MNKTVLAVAVTSALFCGAVQANGSEKPEPKLAPIETLQALKAAMGNVSRDDMEGYKSLFILAQSPEAKKDVIKMMLVAETSTEDVFNALLNNEQATTWLLANGYAEPNKFGKLIPTEQWSDDMNPKRDELWGDHVGDTQKALNAELQRLAKDDPEAYAKAIDVLGNIGVQKGTSILDYIGHDPLNDEVVDEFNGDLEKEIISREKQKLEEKWAEKSPASGKQLMDEVDSILGEDALKNYAMSEDKQQASQSILESASPEQKQLLNLIYVPNPNAGSSSQPETISLLNYLEGVAGIGDAESIEPQPPITGGSEVVLREAGKNLDNYLRNGGLALRHATENMSQALKASKNNLHEATSELDYALTSGKMRLEMSARSAQHLLSAELVKLQQQIDDLNNGVTPGTGDISEELIGGLVQAREQVEAELAQLDKLVLENANSISKGKVELAIAADDMAHELKESKSKAEEAAGNLDYALTSGKMRLEMSARSAQHLLSAELVKLQQQIDDLNNGVTPGTGDISEELIGGLVQAREQVEEELAQLDKLVLENANSISKGKVELAIAADKMSQELVSAKADLHAAGQTIKDAGKALNTAGVSAEDKLTQQRQQDADALMAALQAMQAQLDAQAKQIAELQSGENPGINPPAAIDQELRDGLQTAGATMQQKMGVAKDKLETAAVGLGYVADAVKQNKNGEVGINPPSEGGKQPSEHEFGSVGDGAAQDWLASRIDNGHTEFDEYVQNGIENGKVRMNDYMDLRLSDFEQELQSMYMKDMENFYEDVDARMDDVMASQHAITNARPFLINGGTAVGVGVGFAGDSSAVAIGVAHSFKDTGWSISGSINATSGSNNDVSAGAGIQYSF